MRTTVDLPPPLHDIARHIARKTDRSLSQTLVALIERGLESTAVREPEAPPYRIDPVTELAVVSSPQPVTAEHVKALEDEP